MGTTMATIKVVLLLLESPDGGSVVPDVDESTTAKLAIFRLLKYELIEFCMFLAAWESGGLLEVTAALRMTEL